MTQLSLIAVTQGSKPETITLAGLQILVAQNGGIYTLVDQQTQQAPKGLVLKRNGDDLDIEVDGDIVAQITEFYSDDVSAAFSVDGTLTPAEGMSITSADNSAAGAESAIVWQANTEAGATDDAGIGLSTALWGGALAGLGVALSDSGSSSSSEPEPEPVASYVVSLEAAAGPFQSVVTVELYDQDGNLLQSKEHDFSTGPVKFTIDTGYQGPLLAKVVDSNGDDGDYQDETTGELISLGSSLRAMSVADGSGDVTMSITPLTELATLQAGVTEDNKVSEENVAVNEQIADLFGVEDILAPVTTVLDDEYSAEDGVDAAEQYGNVLATLSGTDSTTGSIQETLEQLEQTIVEGDDGELGLTQEGVELLQEGVDAFESGENSDLADLSDTVIDPPIINEAIGGLNTTEAADGVIVAVQDTEIGDTVLVQWGEQSHTATVTAADLDATGMANILVPADIIELAGNGNISVTTQVNEGESSPANIVTVDTQSPSVTITDNIDGEANGDITYTFTFSEAVEGFDVDDITISSGTKGELVAVSANEYTLVVTPDVSSTEDITVDLAANTVTDLVGNGNSAAEQSVQTIEVMEVNGRFVGGPVIDGHGLTVTAYNADGVEIGSAKIKADGTYSVNVRGYRGPVLVRVTDDNAAADYMDEGTGVGKDLTVDMRTMTIATSKKFTVNINPLTELAVREMGLAGGDNGTSELTLGSLTADQINATNNKVAEAVGLAGTDLVSADVIETINTDGSANNNFNAYGEALAAVSAMEDSGTFTTDEVLNQLANGLTDTGLDDETTQALAEAGDDVLPDASDFKERIGADTTVETPATPTISLDTDTGTDTTDNLTQNGSFTLSGIEADATVEYSLDNGANWSTTEPIATEGDNNIQVRQTNTAGGVSDVSTLNFTLDTTLPTVVISDDATGSTSDAVTYTFTFSEAVTDFEANDVVVTGGTKGTFTAVSATEYTLVVTPDTNSTTDITVDVAADVATDAAGNNNSTATQSVQSVDTAAPTVTISDDTTGSTSEAVTYTFTFNEDVTGFEANDVVVTGGTKGTFTAVSATEYTLVVTPDTNSTTDITVDVAADVATDTAGNNNSAATQSVQSVDTVIPTVTISDDTAGTAEDDVTYTFTFSEAVTGFDVDDVVVTGGTKGALVAVSATEYTLQVTPDDNSDANITVDIPADVATDAAGNGNSAAVQSVQSVDTLDTIPPTVTISDNTAGTATDDVTYTFTFSEAVTGFTVSDITVAGGTKSTFTAVSATEYTLVVSPDADSHADITVDVAANVVTDTAGNGNTAAVQSVQAVDTVIPSVIISDNSAGTAIDDVTYTFTFSEAVTGFDINDITVTGGTKGTFTAVSATEYTMVVSPDADSQADITVDVAANVATDSAGNGNTAALQSVQAVDTVQPTVTISDDTAGSVNNNSGDVTYTLTFSEAVTGFTSADVTVTGGTKGTFTAVSATEYTLVVTADTDSNANITVDVAADVAVDALGLGNLAANQSVQTVDTTSPGITINDNNAGTTNGDVTYTFTFSEAVTGFAASDIVVTGGTKGTFTAVSETEYTLVVSPDADSNADITVDVAAGVATDNAGNNNTAATQSVQAVDTLAPTVTISNDSSAIATGDITYTFIFSEAVTGFTAGDIDVVGGTKGALTAVSSSEYTLVITPSADSTTNITVDIAANVTSDDAGNGNTAAAQSVQAVDTVPPSVVISDDTPGAINGSSGDITYTFTFSKEVTGFTAGDIDITGGTKGTFTGVSATEYTLVVTPNQNSSTDITVDVSADVALDAAGNGNTAAEQSVQSVDTAAPTVTITDDTSGIASGDVTYTFTFSETVTDFTADDVAVTGGTKGNFTALSTTEYTLVVTPEADSNTSMSVEVAADVATDSAGNNNLAETSQLQTVDTVAPTISINDNAADIATGAVTYTFTFSEGVIGFSVDDIVVTGGTKGDLNWINAKTYTLVVTPDDNSTTDITVDVPEGAAKDTAGNNSVVAEQTIQAVDTIVPTVTITDSLSGTATSNTDNITYTFTFSEDVTDFTVNDITVSGGTKGAFNATSATEYTLVITPDADSTANLTVDVAADAAVDVAGNGNTVAIQSVQTVETTQPSVIITDDTLETANSTSGDITYTFTFNEDVTGFTTDDIVVAGGTKGAFNTTSASIYTLVVTPSADSTADLTVDVAASVAVDAVGNNNVVATQNIQSVDTVLPTVAISDDTTNTATGDVTYTFTFSEYVTDFTADDVVISGGTKGTFTPVSATEYTLVVIPTADSTTNITVDVAAGVATDAAGNTNTIATQSVQTVDTVIPTVTIENDVTGTASNATGDITYTFTFSEDVTDFIIDDIVVSGGTKGAFNATSATVYTLVITPDADSTADLTVDVAADVAVDAAGNGNTVATQSVQAVDTQAGTVTVTDGFISDTNTITVQNSETTTVYIVKDSITVNSESDLTGAADAQMNSVSISTADTNTNLSLDGLEPGDYQLYTVDDVGNVSVAADRTITVADPTIVLFDLTSGQTSNHSDRTFDANETYTIYIKVDTDSTDVQITDPWTGAENLGNDDKIILVGDAGAPLGKGGLNASTANPQAVTATSVSSSSISWSSSSNGGNETVANLSGGGSFYRVYGGIVGTAVSNTATLWSGTGGLSSGNMPSAGFTAMPVSIPFSQGLAYASIDSITDNVGSIAGSETAADSDNTSTDDTELVVKVSLNTTFAIVGDKIQLYNGTNTLGTAATVTANDITNGYVTITTPTLSDGTTYELNATLIDAADNESDASADVTITVDTTAPTLGSSTPADDATNVSVGDDLVLTFDENIALGTGNIVISDGSETLTIDVTSHNNQLSISGNQLTIDPTSDLSNGSSTYNVQIDSGAITDTAGNDYAGITNSTTLNFDTEATVDPTTIVVFDLINGVSSDHNGGSGTDREFEAGVAYTIYIRVDSDSKELHSTKQAGAAASATWGQWTGAANLDADDKMVLVGNDGTGIIGWSGALMNAAGTEAGKGNTWERAGDANPGAQFRAMRFFRNLQASGSDYADIMTNDNRTASFINADNTFSEVYLLTMPAGILTSQGLI